MQGRDERVVKHRLAATIAWSDATAPYDTRFTEQLYSLHSKEGLAGLVRAWIAEGNEGPAMEVNRYQRATWQMWVGNHDGALAELAAGIHSRPFNMIYTAVDPAFAPLRDQPRFREMVKKLGLAEVLTSKYTPRQSASR